VRWTTAKREARALQLRRENRNEEEELIEARKLRDLLAASSAFADRGVLKFYHLRCCDFHFFAVRLSRLRAASPPYTPPYPRL
jgi:hypothetical protein